MWEASKRFLFSRKRWILGVAVVLALGGWLGGWGYAGLARFPSEIIAHYWAKCAGVP